MNIYLNKKIEYYNIMEEYSHKEIFTTKLDIEVSKISNNIEQVLLGEIKNKNGDICNENGYLFKDSIQLLNRSLGRITGVSNKSIVSYIVKYSGNIIIPAKGEIYECHIEEISKMGILAYIKDGDKYSNINESPLLIIIPSPILEATKISIDDYKRGQKIKVIVEAFRIKYNNKQIQIIGKIDA